jgi:hypothetical protein
VVRRGAGTIVGDKGRLIKGSELKVKFYPAKQSIIKTPIRKTPAERE